MLTVILILVIFVTITVVTILKHDGIEFLYPSSKVVVNAFVHYVTLVTILSAFCIVIVCLVVILSSFIFNHFWSYQLW